MLPIIRHAHCGVFVLVVCVGMLFVDVSGEAAEIVYSIHGDGIYAGNLDGTGDFIVAQGNGPTLRPQVDWSAGKIYWSKNNSRDEGGGIFGSNLDGSGEPEELHETHLPQAVALDPSSNMMYWATWTADYGGSVWKGAMDGSGTPTALLSVDGNAAAVAIDRASDMLYFTNVADNSILRCDFNGNNLETILDNTVISETPYGLDVGENGELYWLEDGDGTLRSANLDGSDVQTILSDLEPNVWGIDYENGQLYYSNAPGGTAAAGIWRVDPDGSNPEHLIDTGTGNPFGIDVVPEPASFVLALVGVGGLILMGRRRFVRRA